MCSMITGNPLQMMLHGFQRLKSHTVVRMVQEYHLSADRKYVLFISNRKKVHNHLHQANYKIYNVSNEQIINLDDDKINNRLQYANWGPRGNQIIFVNQNNIYYCPEIGKPSHKLTYTGNDVIYNGIPDWLYGEKIIKTDHAIWWSPDGNRLAFATFNDTSVDTITYPVYGSFNDITNMFTEMVNLKFPRAGRTNPLVTLWAMDLRDYGGDHIAQRIWPPNEILERDHYLTALSWIDDERLAAVWMRREQNYSVVSLCTAYNNWMCSKHLEEKLEKESRNGRVEMFEPPLITKDKRHYLITLPLSAPENGAFRQIVMITINERVKNFLTQGQQDVTKILAHHQETRTVFYSATLENGPGERHIYSVPDVHSSLPRNPNCITCDRSERNCSFNDAVFNPTARYFILKCLGPSIPWTEIRSVDDYTILFKTPLDKKLRILVEERAFPQLRSFRVPISVDHSAEVRLVLPPALREYEDIKYPLVVEIDSEPGHQHVTRKFNIDFGLYLASNRSVVYARIEVRNNPPSRHRNHDRPGMPADHGGQRNGAFSVDDHIRVVNYLRRHYHFIDSSRIGIWGWSFGGYMAASAMSQNSLFNCCVSVAPITNWLYVDSFTAERYFGNPWMEGNFVRYQRADLSEKASSFRGKNLFILHGTADDAVHLQHSFTLMKALNSKEVFYRVQLYPDSNHYLEDVRYHLYRTIELYFIECLSINTDSHHHHHAPSGVPF
ncbi:inactive dipeptidyl peptidase 10-like isoform X2 [Brevipalpus obovatus]|uniref:inactive dipeptidyl peptidase 10-like isoform X2 n=1 Tax=Brevipalpus obovatus TaxID=246614 RepID=UPI003D9F6979